MATTTPPTGWWMYHGDPAHTGYIGSGSDITADAIKSDRFADAAHADDVGRTDPLGSCRVGGVRLCRPGELARLAGELGGTLLKIELQSGAIAHKFSWKIELNERDAHGFCGMGSTPERRSTAASTSSASTPSSIVSMPPI